MRNLRRQRLKIRYCSEYSILLQRISHETYFYDIWSLILLSVAFPSADLMTILELCVIYTSAQFSWLHPELVSTRRSRLKSQRVTDRFSNYGYLKRRGIFMDDFIVASCHIITKQCRPLGRRTSEVVIESIIFCFFCTFTLA